ncbi:MAG: hypothetical protein OXE50_02210 [Chloroflexi bacterium]|nr:hypothetical protein [Chloroflexota bacterium]
MSDFARELIEAGMPERAAYVVAQRIEAIEAGEPPPQADEADTGKADEADGDSDEE